MKKILGTFILLLLGSAAIAWSAPSLTYEVGISSATNFVVTVSTQGPGAPFATNVDSPALLGRVSIEIQNIDSAANLWCTAISTAPATNAGRKIVPGGSWVLSLSDAFIQPGFPQTRVATKIWCLSDGASATKAWVTQAY